MQARTIFMFIVAGMQPRSMSMFTVAVKVGGEGPKLGGEGQKLGGDGQKLGGEGQKLGVTASCISPTAIPEVCPCPSPIGSH